MNFKIKIKILINNKIVKMLNFYIKFIKFNKQINILIIKNNFYLIIKRNIAKLYIVI